MIMLPRRCRRRVREAVPLLGHHDLLTAGEERDLGRLARSGDAAARERLILCNRRLVVWAAKRLRQPGWTMRDLVGNGNVGLVIAADRFDPDAGHRFCTYAYYWIRHYILRSCRDQCWPIRIPTWAAEAVGRLGRRRPDRAPKPSRHRCLLAARKVLAMRAEYGALLRLPDPSSGDPAEIAERAEAAAEAGALLALLPEREREVMRLRSGFDGEPLTAAQVGRRLGCSGAWASKLERRAIARLRAAVAGRLDAEAVADDPSLYCGVYRMVSGKGFCAKITDGGRRVYLGSFPTAQGAARAYDAAARRLYGEDATVNFPGGWR